MSHGYNTSPIFLYQTHKFFPSHINQVALPHFHLKLLPWFHPKSLLKPHKSGFPIYPSCSVKNSFIWTATEIAEAVQGRILRWGPPGSVCTDTRNLESTQWFFAIKGEKFDAHQFVTPELSQRGCVGVIGNRVCKNWDKGFVQINGDTLVSLINMANYAREKFLGTLIGVTGCTGKTTTKAMIALCLEGLDEVYQSHGNWNNRIGVALSLIGLPRSTRVAILEMGMSRKGEILELAKMGRPNVRVILNVGASHLENFGSLEEVAMAKGEILEEAMPGDVVVLNADDPLVMGLHVPRGVKKVLFGQRMGCDLRLVMAERVDGGLGVRVVLEKKSNMVEFIIPSPGLHMAVNACCAAAVATTLGVSLSQVAASLSRFVPVQMRSELEIGRSGIKIINDVYNANPISTKAAIEMLKAIDCKGKKVAILGDMLELGPDEIEYHKQILRLCFDASIDLVGLIGERFVMAAESMNLIKEKSVIHALDPEILALKIMERLNANDMVLLKGSRVMQMEKIVSQIKTMNLVG